MNLTINPIHFYSQSKKTISTQKNATSSYQAKNLLPDYNYALALKNQILFCANIKPQEKEAQYQEIIDKYNLDLSPQKLKEIFSPQALNSRLKIKQARKGSRAFRAFSRSTLHSCFPNKSEEELTDIIPSITREKNKARIIRTLIPRELLKNNPRKSQNELYSQYFNLLLSTIINEGKEDGYKNVQNFLDDFVAPILIPPYRTIKRNEFEELENCIRLQGKNPEDLYTQTRIFRDKCRYRFFYQDKLLAEEFNSELNSEARTKGIQKAIQAIEDKKINLDEPQKEKPYADYRFADKERIKKLEEFQKTYGLKFDNINLLHQAFIYGTMPDKTIISHPYSYEVLEFIGDAVLDFCGKEILEKHLNRTNTNTINQKQESFARNSNLIKAAKKIDLKDLTINIDGKIGEKRNADFFEALIGAIYVDGKEEGFDRAYKFLYDNFKDELLNNAVSN